jgi:hypothetical protein
MIKQLKLFCKDQKLNLLSLLLGIALYNIFQLNVAVTHGFPFPALLMVMVKLVYLYLLYRVSYFYLSKRIKG